MRRSVIALSFVLGCSTTETEPPPPGAPTCAPAPAPVVGGTDETEPLASAAEQCGQAPFSWVRQGLGEVVDVGPATPITAQTITSLASALGVQLPRPPAYDVDLRILTYTTQDRGTLLDASALVAIPRGLAAGTEAELVLYLHGSSGFNDDCSASEEADTRLLTALLASDGRIAVAPDYLGLKNGGPPTGFLNPALVGQPTAVASIDAVRAALRLEADVTEGLCASPRFMTVGGSQGGHAALWVDWLAPYYARELEMVGTVATVPPADMLGEMAYAVTNLGMSSGSASIFFSTGAPWYGIEDRLSEVLEPPQDEAIPERLANGCSRQFTDDFDSIDQLFTAELREAATMDSLASFGPWGCMAQENGVTTTSIPRLPTGPSYGILMVTAEDDEIVNTPVERAAFETLCAAGVPLQYLECAGATHIEGTLWAVGEILDFVDARFAGEPFTAVSCDAPGPSTCRGTPAP